MKFSILVALAALAGSAFAGDFSTKCSFGEGCCTVPKEKDANITDFVCKCVSSSCARDGIECLMKERNLTRTLICAQAPYAQGVQALIDIAATLAPGSATCVRAALCEDSDDKDDDDDDKPDKDGNKKGLVVRVPADCLAANRSCGVFDKCLSLCPGRRGLSTARCDAMEAMALRHKDNGSNRTAAAASARLAAATARLAATAQTGISNTNTTTNHTNSNYTFANETSTADLAPYLSRVLACYRNHTMEGIASLHRELSGNGNANGNLCGGLKGVVADAYSDCIADPDSVYDDDDDDDDGDDDDGGRKAGPLCVLACATQMLLLAGSDGAILSPYWKGVSVRGRTLLRRCEARGRAVCLPFIFAAKVGALAERIDSIRTRLRERFGDRPVVVQELPADLSGDAATSFASRRAGSEFLLVGTATPADEYSSQQAAVYSEVCAGQSAGCSFGSVEAPEGYDDGEADDGPNSAGIIIGIVVAVVVIALIILSIVLIVCCVCYRKGPPKKNGKVHAEHNDRPQAVPYNV